MKNPWMLVVGVAAVGLVWGGWLVGASEGPTRPSGQATDGTKAVLARLEEIRHAAQELDADKVFSFVLENTNGALLQGGRLFLTREAALESTRQGFLAVQKVEYRFDEQHVTLLSPSIALAVGKGSTAVQTSDGTQVVRPFLQSVVLVLTNGEWKVFHAHRSLGQ
jgi:hypothetical protein